MRTFYAFETIRGTWSVRALRRQIDSQYYQRVGWAKNPHKVAALAQGRAEKLDAKDFIKQNTVFEFLGLKPQGDWDESDLEKGILDNLKNFIKKENEGLQAKCPVSITSFRRRRCGSMCRTITTRCRVTCFCR